MSPTERAPDLGNRPVICAVGDLILDIIVLPRAPLARDGDTPATIRLTAGGQAANVAAWSSALGGTGRLICVRGTGPASELTGAQLASLGVEVCGPVLGASGGVVVSTREVDGARTMASDPGVAGALAVESLDPAWVRSADVLHVSGYCLLREASAAAAIAAASWARRVTLDLASAHDIELLGVQRFSERVRALGPELVFANQAERAVMAELDAKWVIKRGADGASFPEGDFAAPAVAVVDSTGAGDALAAGYLIGGPELAMVAAARCVAGIGALPLP